MISNIFNIKPVGKHMRKGQKNDIKKGASISPSTLNKSFLTAKPTYIPTDKVLFKDSTNILQQRSRGFFDTNAHSLYTFCRLGNKHPSKQRA